MEKEPYKKYTKAELWHYLKAALFIITGGIGDDNAEQWIEEERCLEKENENRD